MSIWVKLMLWEWEEEAEAVEEQAEVVEDWLFVNGCCWFCLCIFGWWWCLEWWCRCRFYSLCTIINWGNDPGLKIFLFFWVINLQLWRAVEWLGEVAEW